MRVISPDNNPISRETGNACGGRSKRGFEIHSLMYLLRCALQVKAGDTPNPRSLQARTLDTPNPGGNEERGKLGKGGSKGEGRGIRAIKENRRNLFRR